MTDKKAADFRQIRNVFLILGLLTVVEFVVALYVPSGVLLIIIALGKAGLIVQFFMHVYRLWRPEAH